MGKKYPERKKYLLLSEVTISVCTKVKAHSEGEAIEIAKQRGMVTLNTQDDDLLTEWCTSGELDGEIGEIVVESVEDL